LIDLAKIHVMNADGMSVQKPTLEWSTPSPLMSASLEPLKTNLRIWSETVLPTDLPVKKDEGCEVTADVKMSRTEYQ
jgi:hypothetical protein